MVVECTRKISATSATVSTFLVSDCLIKVRFIAVINSRVAIEIRAKPGCPCKICRNSTLRRSQFLYFSRKFWRALACALTSNIEIAVNLILDRRQPNAGDSARGLRLTVDAYRLVGNQRSRARTAQLP